MNVKQNLQFEAEIVRAEVVEAYNNSTFAKAKVWICRDGWNHHELPITKEAVELSVLSLKNKPLICEIENNFMGHDFLGHTSFQVAIGFFTGEFQFEEDADGHIWIVGECLIWKKYSSSALEILERRDGVSSVSMEISLLEYDEDISQEIELFCFDAVTILGETISPAIDDAKILITSFSKNNDEDEDLIIDKLGITKDIYSNIKFALNKKNEKEEDTTMNKQDYMKNYANAFIGEYANPDTPKDAEHMASFMVDFADKDESTKEFKIFDPTLLKYMIEFGNEYMKEETMAKEDPVEYMKTYMKEMKLMEDDEDNVYMCNTANGLFGEMKAAKPGEVVDTYITIVEENEVEKVTNISPSGDVTTHEKEEQSVTIYKDTYSKEEVVEIEGVHNDKYEKLEKEFAKTNGELDILKIYKVEVEKVEFAQLVENTVNDIVGELQEVGTLNDEKITEVTNELTELSKKYSLETREDFLHYSKAVGYETLKTIKKKSKVEDDPKYAINRVKNEGTKNLSLWERLQQKHNIKIGGN